MREYELIYVIQPDAAPEREAEIHERIEGLLERGSGVRLLRDDWGKRKLAYEVRKFQKGHYFQLNFLGEGPVVPEVERTLRLEPDVLRFLTVQANDDVTDIETRVEQARVEEAERAKRRAEREALEAERQRERDAAAAAQAPGADTDRDDDDEDPIPSAAAAAKPRAESDPSDPSDPSDDSDGSTADEADATPSRAEE